MSTKPHSADYFGDTRDFWWNRDFLELMGARWKLAQVRRVLDVGCGVGHWGRCLAPLLPPGCELTGVDREPQWIEEARKRSAGITHLNVSFQQGDAGSLSFPDNHFDLVTCQTVLIHVKDPQAVLREMIRVLAPGGLIVAVEPNNAAAHLSDFRLPRPVSEQIALLEFQMTCERGKMNLGEGFNSIGPHVPGWLSEQGVEHVEAHISDKTTMLLPPYESAQERAIIREAGEMIQRQFWNWSREDALRYFSAGGGAVETFEDRWHMALDREREMLGAAERGDLRVTYAPICLIASGRKKRASSRV